VIPYGRQSVDDDDIAAVVEVLRGDYLTQGPTLNRFEEAIAERTDARHAVAFANGTAALHGAVAVAGLGPGDVVATSPLTFMASANCARYVGATVELVDISADTWNIDLRQVRHGLDGLVAVHYAGLPVDLRDLSNRPRIVIEDAAHALGAQTPSGPVGNCAHSDMCCFSFHPVKPVTTGEGGVVTTNSDEHAEALRRFRSHGIVRRPGKPGWHYEIAEIGFNYRLTDIGAALGISQLRKLTRFIDRRNEIAELYRELLRAIDGVALPPAAPTGFRHAYHLFPVWVADRHRVFDELHANGIRAQVHYVPIHHHPISADIAQRAVDLPVCEQVYEGLLSLPMYPALTDDQVRFVTRVLVEALADR
jgi:dTDP-4-amino-4,6-dideoxygalactose transaminase